MGRNLWEFYPLEGRRRWLDIWKIVGLSSELQSLLEEGARNVVLLALIVSIGGDRVLDWPIMLSRTRLCCAIGGAIVQMY